MQLMLHMYGMLSCELRLCAMMSAVGDGVCVGWNTGVCIGGSHCSCL